MVSKNKVKEEGKQKKKIRSACRAPIFRDSYLETTWALTVAGTNISYL